MHAIISLIPKIIAKSDSDSINSSHSFLDSVHKPILQKIVRDLSSFHTRRTESEFIDNVAYWLTEKLQNVCSHDVYVHNFTHIRDVNDNADSNKQQEDEKAPIHHLKKIA